MKDKRLHILYISQYFPPEIGATQTRAFEMASHLVRMGHRVTVLTEFPNHPKGVIPPAYRFKLFMRETHSGIDVIRTWVYVRPNKNFWNRIYFYLSFMILSMIIGILMCKKIGVVYATSPPLFVALSGFMIGLVKGIPFVMEVRDLWPESAVILGELQNPMFIRISEKIEKFLYRRAVRIVGVTEGIVKGLKERSVSKDKIELIYNGANVDLYRPGERNISLLNRLGISPSSFTIMYTGLHGLMHGLEFVIHAANDLRNESDIKFIFIGEGVRKAYLIDLARRYRLKNTLFLESLQEVDLPQYIRSFDIGLVTTKKLPFCRGTLPVKMFTYMACEKPVLLCVDGEARHIVENSKAGIYAEPENKGQLIQAIHHLKKSKRLCREMGKAGRKFVVTHFSRRQMAKELENILMEIV
ncbi:glycosyltransferase family 4 protein [bacterium]|nr:glycosyltransferase family 4 protein [bacterium]RQV92205.1 MAG: glycosyltransferase WbuB [bacterium]